MNCLPTHQRAAKVLIIALMMSVLADAQDSTNVAKRYSGFYGYFGLGIGFLTGDPDLEPYANDLYSLKSTAYAQDMSINPEIEINPFEILLFDAEVGVAYRYYQIETLGAVEYAIGNFGYHFSRTSPTLGGNLYFPFGSTDKHAMFLGSALNYNFINADEFNGSNWGFRIQYGFSFQYGNWDLQPYLTYNSCKVTASYHGQNINLNFSSIQIGVFLSGHSIIYFKD